jgi:hypothetical protein
LIGRTHRHISLFNFNYSVCGWGGGEGQLPPPLYLCCIKISCIGWLKDFNQDLIA